MSTAGPPQQQPRPPAPLLKFGPFEIPPAQIFLTTRHSFALVNLKPLRPGHVLVCPKHPHARFTDLALPEVSDLFDAVQRVQRVLARHYFQAEGGGGGGGSFNIALQDGPEAGQTVPHVHVHVIPRVGGGGGNSSATGGDVVYEQMAGEAGNVGGALWDSEKRKRVEEDDDGGRGQGSSSSLGGESSRPRPGGAFASIEDEARPARGMADMEAEAGVYRALFLEELRGRVDR